MRGLLTHDKRCCVLGCGRGDDDVYHYLRCEVFWSYVIKNRPAGLGITSCSRSAAAALLVSDGMQEEDKVRMALGIYALHRTVQVLRHHSQTTPLDKQKLLKIWTRRAADNSNARSLLRWDDYTTQHNTTLL